MRKFNIKVNGKTYMVEVEEADGVTSAAAVAPAPVVAQAAVPAPVQKPAGGEIVSSPMPGTVLKLAVANGATVKKGDKILVLEAMKMENDINAVADGVVTFLVKEGDSVETGADLASIG